jgi:iron(III) transport system permease protein
VPVLLIFINAFWVDGHFNVADVLKVLRQPDTYQALLNSLVLASGVTVTGTCVGTFFAWLVTRTDLPFKGSMKVLFLVPFMLPAFIGALAWKMLLSPRSGYINRIFMDTLGFDRPLFDIYSYAGSFWSRRCTFFRSCSSR